MRAESVGDGLEDAGADTGEKVPATINTLVVKEEVGRVEVLRALRLGHGLRDEHLARAHDLRLERELLERRDERGRLKHRGGIDTSRVLFGASAATGWHASHTNRQQLGIGALEPQHPN